MDRRATTEIYAAEDQQAFLWMRWHVCANSDNTWKIRPSNVWLTQEMLSPERPWWNDSYQRVSDMRWFYGHYKQRDRTLIALGVTNDLLYS